MWPKQRSERLGQSVEFFKREGFSAAPWVKLRSRESLESDLLGKSEQRRAHERLF